MAANGSGRVLAIIAALTPFPFCAYGMPLLHRIRLMAPGLLGRVVLAWFALSLGVAMASPLVNPQALELVCSGAGVMKLIAKTGDGVQEVGAEMGVEMGAAHLDCPMCMPLLAPPPPAAAGACEPPEPLSYVLRSIPAARLAAATAAPLPARGPPRL